ncbi:MULTISPECIES: hypothetical protein [unclassified Imperialibacter]|uniref:hypothetical protein n=1 Tax=unclassified Imperialibacter TaxID=2629706 RepID=UPI0012594DC4|nr:MULTISPECIES: hypothetical protein [unclassified Imperialibacter]CAD5251475.1 hypothetical protein IMPERIA75_150025 [Imperialibacter sp. 75]CAD5266171.1 hypothetical protein IMPERIA89_310037 [Imperialibacter sp. 89]VVT23677.1 hypothetical protein IMPR6_380037 [Imperialibacter sp. EC-SDR9]
MMSDKILTRPWTEFELKQKLAKMPVLPEYKLLIQVREILLDSRLANERLDSLIELIEKIPLHRSQEERDIFIEHLQKVLVDVRLSSELTGNVVKLLRSIEKQS